MKKFTAILLIGVFTLFFTACGDGGDDTPAPAISVNHIGTWQVTTTLSGAGCEGLTAEFIQIIEPLDGDTNTMGTLSYEGTNFTWDSEGNCVLEPISGTSTEGAPSNMTKDEFYEYTWNDLTGKENIESLVITNYTQNSLSIQINYIDGSILNQTFVRL